MCRVAGLAHWEAPRLNRSEPYMTEVVHTTHIADVFDRGGRVPKDEAVDETQLGSVVLWLRISEP